jgi:hypothetical protein
VSFPTGCSGHHERTCPAKVSMVVKNSEVEDVADPSVSRPGNPKKVAASDDVEGCSQLLV